MAVWDRCRGAFTIHHGCLSSSICSSECMLLAVAIPTLSPTHPPMPGLPHARPRQARREGMRAEGLEAEKKLLAAAERRAATEATELSRDKFRLAAELEAARKVHADREGELVKEVARLKEEVGAAASAQWPAGPCLPGCGLTVECRLFRGGGACG